MKIYILPVHESLQPGATQIINPAHNDDYGLEQDFLIYLQQNQHLLVQNPGRADFHYLPVFWWRWICNHPWGNYLRRKFINQVKQAILDDSKTFTIVQVCQRQLATDLGKTIVFSTGRSNENALDLPLLCKPHLPPTPMPELKYLVSFAGRLDTHPIRKAMVQCFANVPNSYFYEGHLTTDLYATQILESAITLCPRGWGGSSYRFFETMQLGRVPFLIGDFDTRPFKKYIPWDQCSFYAASPQQAVAMVQNCRREALAAMGRECAQIWWEKLNYGQWCRYVLNELSDFKKISLD
jgi:hypothetical protein